jgi:predicted TIM-barrel fold metal-dependent hydrolase
MLVRTDKKSEDDQEACDLPIPTQFISNGEFYPFPQTPQQRTVERLINEMADERARKLGWSRRRFLQSACGTATALAALNIVSGCTETEGFAVADCATIDENAARETFKKEYFIVDVQTHHADLEGPIGTNEGLQNFFRAFRICQPGVTKPDCNRGVIAELSRANYIKEVLLDSETAVAMMSGIPAPTASTQLIGNAAMAATRDLGNEMGASQRMLTQGMLTPNFPAGVDTRTSIEDMDWMVNELGIVALKTYTGAGGGLFGSYLPWWLDDEEVAYPMYEKALSLGINVVNTHKGLRLGIFDAEHIHPRDVPKAVMDWPDMNFVIYHSAGEFLDDLVALKTEQIPNHTNINSELGAIFAGSVTQGVDAVGHLLGKLLNSFGPDHIIWGTDSIWYGTPQWQIDALKTFQMPQRLMDEFGYPEVTDEIKAKIFGLNAARLYNLDVEALRCTVLPADGIAKARAAYPEVAQRSLKTYGFKTRREFMKFAFNGRNPLA